MLADVLDDERFQFTPLREGRPFEQMANAIPYIISIHAPPRGATGLAADMASFYNLISIHAPPRGATSCKFSNVLARNFNSRPSARGDSESARLYARSNISIHAPPRGAT